MAVTHQPDLAPVLRRAVASGDFSGLGELLAADAVFDTSNESGRRRIDGRDAIVAHLSKLGPGEVAHWDAREWPAGIAATFEWSGATVDRRRWYLRRDDGEITAIWSYSARAGGDGGAEISDDVLAGSGPAPGASRSPTRETRVPRSSA